MQTVKTPTKVIGGPALCSYVHVFEPKPMKNDQGEDVGKPVYSTTLLIPKSNKALIAEIKKAIEAAIEVGKAKKWGGKIPKGKFHNPLQDGDEHKNEDYAGHWYLNAKASTKPGIIDRDRNPLTSDDDFYSGVFARFSVTFFPYNKMGNGVACGLNHLQKLKDGERLGGRASIDEDFADDIDDMDLLD